MTEKLRSALADGLSELGVPGEAALVDNLLHYLGQLEKWNRAYNLTAVRDPEEMVTRHILDSISVAPYISGQRIIDVGTGAGLPGIPLALAYPDQHWTLLDTNGKKVRFLEHVIGELGLPNAHAVQARVEEYTEDGWFDTVVCRAFTSLPDFVAVSGHLAAPEGRLVAMKGKLPQQELDALPGGWEAAAVEQLAVPGVDGERHVIVLRRDPSQSSGNADGMPVN
jgi:16S rRNA (guanine527-N7)-methyltransferase